MSALIWTTALILSYICFKVYKMVRVPKALQHLPVIPITSTLPSILRGESYDVMYNKFYRPVLEEHGIARAWVQGNWDIIINNPLQIRTILSKTDKFLKQPPGEKSNQHMLLRKTIGMETIISSDGEAWRRHRRVANPAFKKAWSNKLFIDCTEELIEKINSYNGEAIAVQDLFQKLTLDALGRGIFSYDFEAIKSGEDNYNLRLYNEVMGAAFDPFYFAMPFLENLTPSRRHLHRRGQEFRQFLKSIIQTRKKEISEGSDNDDLLSLMIRASDDEKNAAARLSDDEVVGDLGTFFVAGHDTTANTLSSMFYYLSRYPEVQGKARKEVISILGESSSGIEPTTEQLKEMTYIECIIKENMRCITTIPQIRRYCTEETELPGGLVVPKDTYITLQNWDIHHDSIMYKDPEVFNPERFNKPHSPEDTQWMAFGSGPRMCIGKNFSLIEQRIALVMLLQRFTFSLGERSIEQKVPELNPSGFIHPINLEVKFTPII